MGKDAIRDELGHIAFEAHRDQPRLSGTADVRHERLLEGLYRISAVSKANLADLEIYVRDRAGLLVERGNGVCAFPHRTFQEYLAACHLTDANFPGQLARLAQADPERWREVTLLAGAKARRGTSSAAWNLAEALCPRSVAETRNPDDNGTLTASLLAAQTLVENEGARLGSVDAWNVGKLERIRQWMQAIVTRGWMAPRDRAQAGAALAVLGDDRDFDELATVPAGSFWMGSAEVDEMAADDEKPLHEITLPAFRIGKYPVTNRQYLRFVEATGQKWDWEQGRQADRANYPAVGVTWHDARAYCDWLTGMWRVEGRIKQGEEVRLPSECEWEKAARGSDGRLWPWGSEWDEANCNNGELNLSDASPVGMFPTGASPYGCLDMAGNTWEWTMSLWGEDWQKPQFGYPYDPADGREDRAAGDKVSRVLRGGSFSDDRHFARCASRFRYSPLRRYDLDGFRVVVSPISSPPPPSTGSGQAPGPQHSESQGTRKTTKMGF